jgi:hypothetical protein
LPSVQSASRTPSRAGSNPSNDSVQADGAHGHLDLREARDDHVGARRAKAQRLTAAIDADDGSESARAPGLDPGDRVLHDGGARGLRSEPPRALEELVGRGLARELRQVQAVDPGVEQPGDPGGLEDDAACSSRTAIDLARRLRNGILRSRVAASRRRKCSS